LLIVFCKIDKLTLLSIKLINTLIKINITGADPGFQVRGRGALEKNCAERREAQFFGGYFV
jgi:hypothetical protein